MATIPHVTLDVTFGALKFKRKTILRAGEQCDVIQLPPRRFVSAGAESVGGAYGAEHYEPMNATLRFDRGWPRSGAQANVCAPAP
jgi:hypothetical protein